MLFFRASKVGTIVRATGTLVLRHLRIRAQRPRTIRLGTWCSNWKVSRDDAPHQPAKLSFINSSSRCTHRFANGMRCRLLTPDADSSYCANHAAPVENQRASTDIAASLTTDLKEFRSAIPINDFLARLLLLLAQDRISPRKAAVLAYITNPLLRTLPAIDC